MAFNKYAEASIMPYLLGVGLGGLGGYGLYSAVSEKKNRAKALLWALLGAGAGAGAAYVATSGGSPEEQAAVTTEAAKDVAPAKKDTKGKSSVGVGATVGGTTGALAGGFWGFDKARRRSALLKYLYAPAANVRLMEGVPVNDLNPRSWRGLLTRPMAFDGTQFTNPSKLHNAATVAKGTVGGGLIGTGIGAGIGAIDNALRD